MTKVAANKRPAAKAAPTAKKPAPVAAPKPAPRPAPKPAAKPASKPAAKPAAKAAPTTSTRPNPAAKAAAQIFKNADTSRDGLIDIASEGVTSLGTINTTKVGAQIDRTALLKAADAAGTRDGKATEAELRKLLSRYDADKNGKFSASEHAKLKSYLSSATATYSVAHDGTRAKSERGFFEHGGTWYFRNEWGSVAKADKLPSVKHVVAAPKAFDPAKVGAAGSSTNPCACARCLAAVASGTGTPVQAPPAQPPKGVSDARAGVFDGMGIFVDQPGGFSIEQARAAKAAGYTWIAMQGANVSDSNGEPVRRKDLDATWVASMKALGLKVGIWNVLGTQPARDAQIASDTINQHGLDFFIADAERWHKADEQGGDPKRSQQFVDEFRRLQPGAALALSSYAAANAPFLLGSTTDRHAGTMDYKAWHDGGAVWMPQVYPGEFGPVYSLKNTLDHARRAGWDTARVKPTLGFYRGETPETYADLKGTGIRGLSVYLGENVSDSTYWQRLANIQSTT